MDTFKGDILSFNMEDVVPPEFARTWHDSTPDIHVIGNLPFSVSTPLIIRWLDSISRQSNLWIHGRTPMTLTFQKEVAERIVAPPRSEYRCRLSVMCQYLCHVSLKFSIPGKAFVPPPKVDVGVVKFVPRKDPLIRQPFSLVERINRHLFHHANKYCVKSLGTLFPPDREDLVWTVLELSDIDSQIRPFELTNEQIGQLCDAYATIIRQEPDILTYEFRSQKSAKERRQKINRVLALEQKLLSSSHEATTEKSDEMRDQR
ncbi:rRNA adenine N(6)-methyltransferase [Elysia marginata]|uniref:rRNA adenine N(6)-methyltransferase n=1 Tax=Elysia marginata TaxID=1093978 RepID=A0AAV4GEL2_9GAST|nr:rRNA adenine N(6)-methyltransferase [Elysia marginata]